MNDHLLAKIVAALHTSKKNGEPVFDDWSDLEVCVAGTFAADKFIVIKRRERVHPQASG